MRATGMSDDDHVTHTVPPIPPLYDVLETPGDVVDVHGMSDGSSSGVVGVRGEAVVWYHDRREGVCCGRCWFVTLRCAEYEIWDIPVI